MLVKWSTMLSRWLSRNRTVDPEQFTPWPEGGILVGGAIRDALLGRPARDLDWLVPDPEAAARRLAADTGGSVFALDADRGHWRVSLEARIHDFIRFHGDLHADLTARDFTVNAMALERAGALHDPAGGRDDLSRRRLRMVSRDNLAADPLRLLRAGRIANGVGLRVESATRRAIRALAGAHVDGELPLPAAERVRDELDALLGGPRPAPGVLLLDELGLLDAHLPELAAGRDVEQKGFHHLPVMRHQIEALHQLLHSFPDAGLALRWATLLHDIGKPSTRELGPAGRYRFYGHDRVGADLARDRLRALRHPERRVREVGQLIRWHMLPLPGSEREARRFVHRRREVLPDLLKLMIADREAARGPLASAANRERYRIALARILEILAETPPEPPLLDGREVMELLDLGEGPRVGEALTFLREAQAVGDVADRDAAVAALERYARAQGWIDR